MKKNHKKAIILAIFLLTTCATKAFSEDIDMKADYMEYDEVSKYMVAEGSVTINWKGNTLKAGKIKLDNKSKNIYAEKNICLEDKSNLIYGDKMDYDYDSEVGTVYNAHGVLDTWNFSAKKMKKVGEKKYKMRGINMTSCDHDRGHYNIRATGAGVKVGRRIVTYNPVFFFRGVPFFYFPIYLHAMGPHKDSLEIEPGYNNEDGFIAKVIWGYPLSRVSYGKLYLDYYGRRGMGTGARYLYNEPNKVSADIYGYTIEDKKALTERYTFMVSYWQRLNPLWTAQAQADFVSDSSFSNDYFQDSWNNSNQRIHSFLSFTRQTSRNNIRVLTERYDQYQPLLGDFDPTSITIPRIEYLMYPKKGKSFYTNMSWSLQNQYLSSNDYYAVSGNVDYNITTNYRLNRKLTLKPKIGVRESWQDRTSKWDLTDLFVTRYYSDLNFRYRFLRWIDWDWGHSYQVRTKENALYPDYDANDYGTETNALSFANAMYIRRVTIRNSIGYSLKTDRNEVVNDWREKFTPLVNEFTWAPPASYYLYVREENDIYPFNLNSAQAYINIGRIEKKYLNFGVFYYSGRPDDLDFSTGFGFWPTRKWRLDYTVRMTSLEKLRSMRINDEEIKLFRNIHCWEFRIKYRRRLDNEQIYF
ncbi:LPS-assembly protein LptD, partial [Elusimicrobiota bacterium]